jgi:hypothetical protein
MHAIQPDRVTPAVAALFDRSGPASHRCAAVLTGLTVGDIVVDDPVHPTWAAVRESCDDGQTFLGGALDAPAAGRLITALRAAGDVLIGGWPDDPGLALLPTDPDYDGWVVEWVRRRAGAVVEPLRPAPPGCVVRPIDHRLLARCLGRDGIVAHLGGVERFFAHGFGFCLLDGDAIACEVFACPVAQGRRELWVETHAPYRRRGYALVTCAQALQACDAAGQQPYWNTARQNQPSIALAHRLGFGEGREYRLLGWMRQAR